MDKACKFCGAVNTGGIYYTAVGGESVFACWKCEDKAHPDMEARKKEEIKELELTNKCTFNLSWIGWCKKDGFPFCDEHKKEHCRVCEKQATRQCSNAGSLVCGLPLCESCKCPSHKM